VGKVVLFCIMQQRYANQQGGGKHCLAPPLNFLSPDK
jgi:hypothetical protein